MLVTTLLTTVVAARWCLHSRQVVLLPPLLLLMGGIGTLEALIVRVAACSLKFVDGAWFPLVVAAVIFFFMSTWARGSAMLQAAVRAEQPPLAPFLAWLAQEPTQIQRTPRVAVYRDAVADADVVPPALALNRRHYQARRGTSPAILGRSVALRSPPRTDQQRPMHPSVRGSARVPCTIRVMRLLAGVCWLAVRRIWLAGVCWQARARTGVWWQAYGGRCVLADMCSQA